MSVWVQSLPSAPTEVASSRRSRVARALDAAGLLDLALRLRARVMPRHLTILTYHRVASVGSYAELDQGVFDATPEGFEEQLNVAAAYGHFVSLSDVEKSMAGGPLPSNPILLTFDDAYRDVLQEALPVLRRMSAPAALFVPTGYPESGRLFWWDKIALLVRRSRVERLAFPGLPIVHLTEPRGVDQAVRRLTGVVKSTFRLDLDAFFERLEQATGVTLGAGEERSLAHANVLDWRGIRSLEAAGVELGSHGHEHRVLRTLSPDEARLDLQRSREVLEDVLGRPVRSVAYPVGYPLTKPYRDVVASAGYSLGFTNGTGLAGSTGIDPLGVPRLATDLQRIQARFKAGLVFGGVA